MPKTKEVLNQDQIKALDAVVNWYRTSERFLIISGAGGTGKSFLINHIIKKLKVSPLLLCPTNEALQQLRDKIDGEHSFKTIHSALGIAPTDGKEELTFEQLSLPAIWDEVDFCIVDEASMISEELLKILQDVGKKMLFVGHASQLPPVVKQKSLFSKCISPVFQENYRVLTLTIPMRNTGKLWEFNNNLEEMIYSKEVIVPSTFDIKKSDLVAYMHSEQGKKEIFDGDTKFVLWSNNGVDRYNHLLRSIIFGERAKEEKYLKGDKILLTKPVSLVPDLDTMNDSILKGVNRKTCASLYSNTKAEVICSVKIEIRLNSMLVIPVYKITCFVDEAVVTLFDVIDEKDLEKVNDYYKHLAWKEKGYKDKEVAFKFQHFVVSCFAVVKHSYAQTSHRLQGSGVKTAVVILSDLQANMTIVERKKCLYVACSRAIDNLMLFRGVL